VSLRHSAGRVRKPVAEDLLGGEPAPFESGSDFVRCLSVPREIILGELRRYIDLFCKHPIDITPKARAVPQKVFDLDTSITDRRPPPSARIICR